MKAVSVESLQSLVDKRKGRQRKRRGMIGELDPGHGNGQSKKCLYPNLLCPENILEVKSTGFADGLDVG